MAAMELFDAGDDIVQIIANSGEGAVFSIHRTLLTESSSYLRSMLNDFGNDSNTVYFKTYGPVFITTEIPSDAIRCFVQWLYTGNSTSNSSSGAGGKIKSILGTFGYTDKQLANPGFRDFLVDQMIDILKVETSPENIYAILEHLDDANGGMLMFLTGFLVHTKLNSSVLSAEIAERLQLCKNKDAILNAVAQSFLELKISEDNNDPNLPPWLENRCQYHEHSALTCCSKSPGVALAEARSELRTPPPAPKKQKRKRLGTVRNFQLIEEDSDEIILADQKKPRLSTPTPARFTRSSLRTEVPKTPPKPQVRRGRNVPRWSTAERIEILRIYWLNPDLNHVEATARHNEGYCAERGFERAVQGLGGQYRDMMGGSLEETRDLIPNKIAELEMEAEMEAQMEGYEGWGKAFMG